MIDINDNALQRRSINPASVVLHVAWLKSQYGGAHKYLERLVQCLLERKWRVLLAVNQQELDRPFLRELNERGAEVFYIPLEESPGRAADQLDQIVRQFHPDLVHFNSGAKQPRDAARFMTSRQSHQYRSVFTMHLPLVQEELDWKEKLRAALPFTNVRRRVKEKGDFARKFDRIISVSKRFSDINVRSLKLDPKQMTTIPNGVDLTKFAPSVRKQGVGEGPITIGSCGSLVHQKRFDLLIAAANQLKSHSVVFRIAGEGPERKHLQRLIDQYDLSDRFFLTGHQSDVPGFLCELDIFVMSSDYEAFPYAQLEAMASGLPSVVTDVGDLPLMVRNRQEGLVIPPSNAPALTTGLETLITNETLRSKMGKSARNRVVQNYEQNECELRTIDLFESLLNQELAVKQ